MGIERHQKDVKYEVPFAPFLMCPVQKSIEAEVEDMRKLV